ncbi:MULTISPECIES: stage V sporulation protein AE [Carboxydocella]|uniref:Stage V sporulation protein AE n=2 Tax=Carboxydocella TaxID=178898 RepID=A0A1T4MSU2_9FIRM|nr:MULTISPECIES: stage V sporulation protein AE [Carboxydocella]AVX20348.1 stage V sporulation protein AE [Carboxydocella thermautotrophica]AVX30772.1 stage V sporulation protein AE [Carboxydocella thermautotrophica]SJZ69906.1 stage V sporulation protein AE [Carboxydocella sporoproducens DSM 16521]GAW30081.1 stage V sporulation protein AE [Carboxydocella sp. ULO1]GAW31178.1 stage V sporulation protein AE [Carboxydocella sp. JDF658]
MGQRKRVILVTDGDKVARKAVEKAAANIKAHCISASAGNPTPISGPELLQLIREARGEPVVIMVDDRGKEGQGKGEQLARFLAKCREVEIIGAVAVASNDKGADGVRVDCSITADGKIISGPVDKEGQPEPEGHLYLEGDTVDMLRSLGVPVIVGIGDIGKQQGADSWAKGAPLTTKALRYIIEQGGNQHG